MGINGLTKFLADKAEGSIEYVSPKSLLGRWVAVDASLSLYQFMVAIRDSQDHGNLQNAAGEVTSHISGILTRATRILELGVKPVYVFDGKAPLLKTGELAKRKDRKAQAEVSLAEAREEGDEDKIRKFAGRTVRVTRQHNEDIKKLLLLMGIPVVQAPGEAEAQCADLCKRGMVHAVATEDADALCFGTPLLLRKLQFNDSKEKDAKLMMIKLKDVLEQLDFTMEQFVDFCILCGCDYCDTIKGIGASSAFKLIKQHTDLPTVLEQLDKEKFPIPPCFPYEEARKFFEKPDILEEIPEPFAQHEIDEEGLRKFLVEENQFNETRVENAIVRLKKARKLGAQTRIDSFFGLKPSKETTDQKQEKENRIKTVKSEIGGLKRPLNASTLGNRKRFKG